LKLARTPLRRAIPILAAAVASLGIWCGAAVAQADTQSATQQAQAGSGAESPLERGSVNLRPRFEEGQRSRFEFWIQTETTEQLTVRGETREAASRSTVEGQIRWEVLDVASDGSAECLLVFEWITLEAEGPDGEMLEVDTRESDAEAGPAAMLRAMTDVDLVCEVNADGSIESVDGSERIAERAGAGTKAPSMRDLIKTASDLATLPHAPQQAAPGSSWQIGFPWNHALGVLHHETVFRLRSVERIAGIPVANVEAEAELKLEPDTDRLPEQLQERTTIRFNGGEARSQIIFDLDRHEAVGRNSTRRTDLELEISLPQGPPLTRRIRERVQSQVLRLEATGG
jgi:hypothetical protein